MAHHRDDITQGTPMRGEPSAERGPLGSLVPTPTVPRAATETELQNARRPTHDFCKHQLACSNGVEE